MSNPIGVSGGLNGHMECTTPRTTSVTDNERIQERNSFGVKAACWPQRNFSESDWAPGLVPNVEQANEGHLST